MGRYLQEQLAGTGIDLYVDISGKTSMTAVAVDRAGDRTSITFHENTPLEQIPVPLELISRSRYVYACGCYGRNAALMGRQAQATGIPSVLNANCNSMDFIGSFDVAIASEASIGMPGRTPAEAAVAMAAGGVKLAIVTMGEQGCVCRGKENLALPAYKVDPVDCTGAGAAFAAGFIHAGLLGCGLPERVRLASAAGALKCMHRGSYRRIGREELLQFVKSHG
jgi:sugar/nucleoside kinase (ribokinase family)